ncbi:MAG: GGDEF domain-containing protein [Candidatus Velthaea sp.]
MMASTHNGQTVVIMFEDSPIAMCNITVDGTILRRNAACEMLFPKSASSIFDLVARTDRGELAAALQLVNVGQRRAFRVAVDADCGKRIEISGIPQRNGTGDLILYFVDVSVHHQREEHLREVAERDALTGLLNRAGFEYALSKRLTADPVGTLMMIDLDGFKRVNDTYGHGTGDTVLIHVARALTACAAEGDIVARLGGDEFAVILRSEANAANAAASMLIRRVEIAAAVAARGISVSASVGIAPLMAGLEPAEVLEDSDRAMYSAKHAGKGRCVTAVRTIGKRSVSTVTGDTQRFLTHRSLGIQRTGS